MIVPNATAFIPLNPSQKVAPTADSAESITSSANIASDFIGLLTEMIGPIVTLPATDVPPSPNGEQPGSPTPVAASDQNPPETAKTSEPKTEPKTDQTAVATVPVMHFVVVPPQNIPENAVIADDPDRTQNVEQPPQPASPAVPPTVVQQAQLEQMWSDVKKFEFNIEKAPAHVEADNPQVIETSVQPQKQVIVTTDPLASIQLQQLPPRVMAVEKIVHEMKLAARGKSETAVEPADKPAPASPFHFADVTHSIEPVEQALPASYMEIRQPQHLPVWRTVPVDIG